MKSNTLYLILILPFLAACGGQEGQKIEELLKNPNLEDLRSYKSSLSDSQKDIEEKMHLVDSAINALDSSKKLPLVTTIVSEPKSFEHFVELQGIVKTKQNILIYPEVAGRMIKVNVKEGQKVNKGQVLAVIDDGGIRNQLKQMKTELELAKTTFERQKNLWEKNVGSEIQYLQAKTSYEAREQAVKQMEIQVSKFTLRAPISGVIDNIFQFEGTVVSPGPSSQIFRVVNLGDMYIEVDMPESYIPSIKEGNKVLIDFPVLGEQVVSAVRNTGNFINPNNRSFTVEITVPNESGLIKPNMTAKVSIKDYLNPEALMIPQSIISENAEGDQFVYAVNAVSKNNTGIAEKTIVNTGKSTVDMIEVTEGLEAGVQLIKEGARSIKDGQEVQILKN